MMSDATIESARNLLASLVPPKDEAKNLGASIPTQYRWVPTSTCLAYFKFRFLRRPLQWKQISQTLQGPK